MGKTYSSILFGAIIGLILSLSQPFFGWWFLVFPGFILIFLGIKMVPGNHFLFGYSIGLVYYLIDFRWYWAVYPLKNLGIENRPLAFFFVFLTWIITAGTMAFLWGLLVWLFRKIDPRVSSSALLIFPSLFTLAEYARSFFIALVWVGPQTPIGPFWTIGNLAYNFHQSFLVLKFASWFGIYGVDFVIVFLSLLLFIFLEKRSYKKFLILLSAIFILFYLPNSPRFDLGSSKRSNLEKVEVAVIQTDIPSKHSYTSAEEASFFKTQLELVNSISQKFPQTQLIVFPEESNFFTRLSLFKNASEVNRYFSQLFDGPVLILDNSQLAGNGKFQARTIFLDTKKGVIGSYDKYLVTPGAEYVPLLFRGLDKLLGINSPELKNIQEYETGAKWPEAVDSGNGLKLNSLVCADIFSPHLAGEGARTGSNLLISQSSFAFGHSPKDLVSKDLAASQFRAAETGRYLIKSANSGLSYIISNQGKVLKSTFDLKPQILTGSVVLKDTKTLYNKVGDGPILLASLMAVLASLIWLRPKQ